MNPIHILAGVRTAIGDFGVSLKDVPAPTFGRYVLITMCIGGGQRIAMMIEHLSLAD